MNYTTIENLMVLLIEILNSNCAQKEPKMPKGTQLELF